MVNAVIYSRVSSIGNRQENERQTNELTEYAARATCFATNPVK